MPSLSSIGRLLLLPAVLLPLLLPPSHGSRPSARVAAATSLDTQTPTSSCNCEDLPDLISRRHEVHAAIAAIDKQAMQLEEDQRRSGEIIPYKDTTYDQFITLVVQEAMDAAHDKSSHQAQSPTKFTRDCSSTIDPSTMTACLWQGVELNQAERQTWCEQTERGGAGQITQTLRGDWMARYPLANFAAIARQGYARELYYLDRVIKRVSESCQFGKWTGEITVTYGSEFKYTKNLPAPGVPKVPHQLHGTEQFRESERQQVTITVVDGKVLAEGTGEYSTRKETHMGDEIWCHASTKANAFVPWSSSAIEVTQVSGPTYLHPAFGVGFDNAGTYTITATLPEGWGSGTALVDRSETGECAAKPVKDSHPIHKQRVGGFLTKGKGNGRRTDLMLDGSYEPKAETSTIGDSTSTRTMTMQWHLKRSSPQ